MPDPETPAHGASADIDLDRDPDPEPPPRPRIPNAAIGLVAAVIMLVAATILVWKWWPFHTPQAETAVREYLEAVRTGDVEAALAITDGFSDAATDFLVPEALDARWKINEIAQVGYTEGSYNGDTVVSAQVYVEIEAFDGTRLGDRLNVRFFEGDAGIHGGMRVDFFSSEIVEHLEINGLVVDDLTEGFGLFPGVYEFYEQAPSTIDMNMPSVLVLGDQLIELGGDHTLGMLSPPTIEATDEGRELVAERLREHFDACAARPEAEDCPFAPPPESEGRIALADEAEWTITAYPEAATLPWRHGDPGHELVTIEPGRVEVPATVTEPGGGTRQTTLSCAIRVDGFHAEFDFDGGVTIEPNPTVADSCRSMAEAA